MRESAPKNSDKPGFHQAPSRKISRKNPGDFLTNLLVDIRSARNQREVAELIFDTQNELNILFSESIIYDDMLDVAEEYQKHKDPLDDDFIEEMKKTGEFGFIKKLSNDANRALRQYGCTIPGIDACQYYSY